MNWLGMIVSYFAGSMNKKSKGIKESVFEIYDEIIIKSRRIITLCIVGLGSVIFLCGGIFISLVAGTTQYDRVGYVQLNATMGGGLVLIALSLVAFGTVFWMAWPRHPELQKKRKPSAAEAMRRSDINLEQALSLLLLDFVKEREFKREMRQSEFSEGNINRQRSQSSLDSSSSYQH